MKIATASTVRQINSIVGRRHVAESFMAVLRYVVSRIDKKAWAGLRRDQRRWIIREVFKAHKANRDLFNHYRF